MFGEPLPELFYARDTVTVAREMIGRVLVYETEVGLLAGRIVETEAYGADDPANHAFRGMTLRNRVMFGRPGLLYVYLSYGMHWCINAVTMAEGVGEAVLIRALEPLAGITVMEQRRGTTELRRLCKGPGSVGQAFSINGAQNGSDLTRHPLFLTGDPIPDTEIMARPRIGISRATERLWRFCRQDSPFLSRK